MSDAARKKSSDFASKNCRPGCILELHVLKILIIKRQLPFTYRERAGGSLLFLVSYASTARLRTSASACDTGGMQMIIKVMIASGTR